LNVSAAPQPSSIRYPPPSVSLHTPPPFRFLPIFRPIILIQSQLHKHFEKSFWSRRDITPSFRFC
jgi:hypothetical protein